MEQTLVRQKSLIHSTTVFSLMTLLSRVFGFIRDMVVASLFGVTAGVDAFFVAFRIPNFLRRLFAEGAFSQAFVPVLSEYQHQQGQAEVKQFLNRIAGNLTLVLTVLTIVAVIATPIIILIFAPGFGYGTPRFEMATFMLRITFPYLLLISLTAMSGAVLNTYGYFGVPAFTPVLLNLSIIGAAVWLSPYLTHPVEACAWGVLIAGIVQLLFQIPFLAKLNVLPKPEIAWRDPAVKRVLKLMVPALFGVSVAQINLTLDTVFASFLKVGSVSWLYYSDRIMEFPLGMFGVGIATVILPHLSRKHAENSVEQYSAALDWAIRSILLIGLPSMVGLMMLAGPILVTLFDYGKFTAHDVAMARLSLMAFGFGLPACMLIKSLASGFYAKQNIKLPVKIGVVALISNTVLNLILMYPLAHAGLALSTSISAFLNAGLLWFFLRRHQIYTPVSGWRKYGLQLLLSNILVGVFIYFSADPVSQWLDWRWSERLWHLILLLVGAISVYFAGLWLMGVRVKQFRLHSHGKK
ncbi:MAG: murein biosynthesis integral membrane protein MurJ [Proteobacteria bacterium]|nr:murein biosynthesis integral membrane protein MurJ [Pseudomonadota bacterium]